MLPKSATILIQTVRRHSTHHGKTRLNSPANDKGIRTK